MNAFKVPLGWLQKSSINAEKCINKQITQVRIQCPEINYKRTSLQNNNAANDSFKRVAKQCAHPVPAPSQLRHRREAGGSESPKRLLQVLKQRWQNCSASFFFFSFSFFFLSVKSPAFLPFLWNPPCFSSSSDGSFIRSQHTAFCQKWYQLNCFIAERIMKVDKDL